MFWSIFGHLYNIFFTWSEWFSRWPILPRLFAEHTKNQYFFKIIFRCFKSVFMTNNYMILKKTFQIMNILYLKQVFSMFSMIYGTFSLGNPFCPSYNLNLTALASLTILITAFFNERSFRLYSAIFNLWEETAVKIHAITV